MNTPAFDLAGTRVFVAGHNGMVGSALMRRLATEDCELLTADRRLLDLTDQAQVESWLQANQPDVVLLAAARVGGILANSRRPAEFIRDNLAIELNVIHAAWRCGVRKLVFLGSSCIYPKFAAQPIDESSLLTGALEPSNEWYAVAKIAGVKLCQAYRKQYDADFISLMPTNLYGPGDNFHPEESHVLPALIRRFDEAASSAARVVEIWGSGKPRREFLHVDDAADACVHCLRRYSGADPLNIGTGEDIAIADLAALVAAEVGFSGALAFDTTRPDGTPVKRLNVARLHALGWRRRIGLRAGIRATIDWYRANRDRLRGGAGSS